MLLYSAATIRSMNLSDYLKSNQHSVSRLARAMGVTLSFVCHIRDGIRQCPPAHCITVERETGGAVSRKELRPTDWQKYWPDA